MDTVSILGAGEFLEQCTNRIAAHTNTGVNDLDVQMVQFNVLMYIDRDSSLLGVF